MRTISWNSVVMLVFFALVTRGAAVFALAPAESAPIKLTDVDLSVSITDRLDVLEDPSHIYADMDIFDKGFNTRFSPMAEGKPNIGFSASDWWLRIPVLNDTAQKRNMVVLIDYPLLDFVDAWVLGGGEVLNSWRTGRRKPYDSRPIQSRYFMFPLELEPNETQQIYVKIRSTSPLNLGVKLMDAREWPAKLQAEYFIFGIYYGCLLLLATCIGLFFLVDRRTAYLYYFLYVVTHASYMFAFNGLAFQFFWPASPEFGIGVRIVLLTVAMIFMVQFSRTLLEIERHAPRLNIVLRYIVWSLMLLLALFPAIGAATTLSILGILMLTILVLLIVMGVVALKAGEDAAKYYLIGWSVLLIGLFIYMMKIYGLLPHNFVTHNGFQIGAFFEFSFLSIALGSRIRDLRRLSKADALTGLGNRRSFDEALENEFGLARRPTAQLSMLVIDVDHFKSFNDRFGHAEGDRVLIELAKLLKQNTRRPSVSFRYGGEEFVIILPRTSEQDALALGERLREKVKSELEIVGLSISIGLVSKCANRFENADAFFVAGDKALYKAKNTGRDKVVVYREGEMTLNDQAESKLGAKLIEMASPEITSS